MCMFIYLCIWRVKYLTGRQKKKKKNPPPPWMCTKEWIKLSCLVYLASCLVVGEVGHSKRTFCSADQWSAPTETNLLGKFFTAITVCFADIITIFDTLCKDLAISGMTGLMQTQRLEGFDINAVMLTSGLPCLFHEITALFTCSSSRFPFLFDLCM